MKERPFGSISIAAEMAASMAEDPRPYLTEEQIAEQVQISGLTRKQWDRKWNEKLQQTSDILEPCPF